MVAGRGKEAVAERGGYLARPYQLSRYGLQSVSERSKLLNGGRTGRESIRRRFSIYKIPSSYW